MKEYLARLQTVYDMNEAICKELASTTNAEAKLSFLTDLLDERLLAEYTNWLKTIE